MGNMRKRARCLLLLVLFVLFLTANIFASSFPISYYDYLNFSNNFSAEVAGSGGLNLTRPHSTDTSYYNPALLAFRETTTISMTYRYLFEKERVYDNLHIPERGSTDWDKDDFCYLGIDSENVGFSYLSFASLQLDRIVENNGVTERHYIDYYLNGYRVSFADRSGLLAFGLNLTLLSGRVVYFRDSILEKGERRGTTGDFIDSRGWGYNLDFGAAVKNGSMSYGLTIPNILGKVYWRDNPDYSLQRRFNLGIQYGTDRDFITFGLSRKFNFSSNSTYHLGLQQLISFGLLRGEYQFMPLRLGLFSEKFTRIKDLGYSIGTGYTYKILQIDVSYMMLDQEKNRHTILMTLSVGL